MTSPVVSTGNWSAWMSVFLMMRSHVAPAPGWRWSSVSTATVRGAEFALIVLKDKRISLNLKYNSDFLLSHPVSSAFDPSPFLLKKCRSHIV